MSKKKKPKKPQSKKVLALLEQLQRRRGVRNLEQRFLIVCEDGKSAPHYFEALKRHFNLSAASIQIAGSGGRTQPLQVVNTAIRLRDISSRKDSGTEPFDQVWCVIDGDYGNKIPNARARAKANQIHLAITTKCFEYWILLHFEECDIATQDCFSLELILRTKQYVIDYDKGKTDFTSIVSKVDLACERAKRLRKPGIDRGDLPEDQNPSSEIYLLIEAIQASPAK